MSSATDPRFNTAIVEVLEPFGIDAAVPESLFENGPIPLRDLLKKLKSESVPLAPGIFFDSAKKSVTCGEISIELTEKEALLLKTLLDADTEVPRETLLKTVWGYADDIDTHTLETHIHRLRAKLKTLPGEPEYIRTTAFGYQFHGTGNHS